MMNYNNSDVVQCLRQYEMFANSLKLIRNPEERNMIIKQLTKLESKIITLTNDIYEEEYNTLANKECEYLDEEKNRIAMLIDLINQRLSYVEKRCNDHYQLTGTSIDAYSVLGADKLDSLEEKLKIIDKYNKNIKLEKELEEDIKSLTNKILLASEKIDINKSLNIELETVFKKTLSDAFNTLDMYSLLDSRDEIEKNYYETEKLLTLAEVNLETAKNTRPDIQNECEEMLDDIKEDYNEYKEKTSIIKLLDAFNKEANDYDELLAKRKEINDILKYIKNQRLLSMILNTVSKQYNTIMMEEQDINTLDDLVLEKERKQEVLSEIENENNSEKFQSVLKVLIENEQKKQERILKEQKRIEELEKKKRLEIERKKQEEILKKQKIIEEARKKEMEKRTKKMLAEQHNSALQPNKKEEKINFESIKDISESLPKETREDRLNLKEIIDTEKQDESLVITKDKAEIEKELFDEFKNQQPEVKTKVEENPIIEKEKIEEVKEEPKEIFIDLEEDTNNNNNNNNKLPDISIDEYMKNFDEKSIDEASNLFDEDVFPSIPM